jgi:AraC-like DNA-binding protein
MPESTREVYEGPSRLLPEIPKLGQNHLATAWVPGLPAHSHCDIFEIFLLERGQLEWWTETETHSVGAGNVYINRPGEDHGSVGYSMKPCSYFWLQLDAQRDSFLPGIPRRAATTIFAQLAGLNSRCFGVSDEVKIHFQSLLQQARERWEPPHDTLQQIAARSTLLLLLVTLLRDAQRAVPRPTISPLMHEVQNFIAAHLDDEISPATLAAACKLSSSHFHERFVAETGFTPHSYITRQRIDAAKRLLEEGEYSIAEIAFRVGFSSSQHFATVFKKIEGISPSRFLQTI